MNAKLVKLKTLQIELTINRIIALGISVISIPYILRNCGNGNYGLYLLICSISLFLTVSDLGIGNGLVNEFASSKAYGNQKRINEVLSNLIVFGVLLPIVIIPFAFLALRVVDWMSLFQFNLNSRDITTSLIICFIGASMTLLGNIALKMLLANSKDRLFSRMQLLISLLTNMGLIISSKNQSPLTGMVFSTLVLPQLIGVICLVLTIKMNKNLKINLRKFSIRIIGKLIVSGRVFLFLQIAYIINYQIDALLIAHFLGPLEIAEYSVVLKIGSLPFILVSAAVQPIWASTAYLIAQSKESQAIRTLYISLRNVMRFSIISMCLFLLFGATLIKHWTFGQIDPSIQLILANALWIPISCAMQVFAMYLNGAKLYKFLLTSMLFFSLFNTILAVLFLKFFSNLAGPIWSNSISSVLFFIIPALILTKNRLKYKKGIFYGTKKN